ncbi:hypothetical protein AAFF_G00211550 [Aldrovandia affinis]|uniref:Reverse transcriptase/retrotransposon-derived protein RNase H-like domain-containing protein n=1 Tax=Aldrovandia affinis TaxID=143900 RepID=A0AAD7WVU1_9TELE|nr:hypothetical protein AAFF_G00211550 [Aldrovandia affinis]
MCSSSLEKERSLVQERQGVTGTRPFVLRHAGDVCPRCGFLVRGRGTAFTYAQATTILPAERRRNRHGPRALAVVGKSDKTREVSAVLTFDLEARTPTGYWGDREDAGRFKFHSAKDKDCTRTTVVQHHIETGSAAPIRQQARRLPLAKWEEAEAKINDILVHAPTYTVALNNLRTAFEQIAKTNLRQNPYKCSLFRQQTSFLGHVVNERGVSTDPAKEEPVEKCHLLDRRGEVHSFLGLDSYHLRFIAGFANIVCPLHQLTEKGQQFKWTSASQDAFDRLHKALTTAPVLAIPDPPSPSFWTLTPVTMA